MIRFRNDSDERACGKAVNHDHPLGPFGCMRRDGHGGECIALTCDAANADGVCHGCRLPLGGVHREDCFAGDR